MHNIVLKNLFGDIVIGSQLVSYLKIVLQTESVHVYGYINICSFIILCVCMCVWRKKGWKMDL